MLKCAVQILSRRPAHLLGCVRGINHCAEHKTNEINAHYDVIIVGGGGAGISLAGAIARNGMLCEKRVLLLDGGPKLSGYDEKVYSNRVFAINQNTVKLMEQIGAWDTIKSIRCRPVKQMQVWDGSSDALITFNQENFAGDIAYIVENDILLYAIEREIMKSENVSIQNNSKIDSVRLACDGHSHNMVYLKSGEVFSAELLVGADGANSMVRKQMDVNHFSLSYHQMGLIATVELSEPDENYVAWQRFLPSGVIASLPLSDSLSSIVWSTDANAVKELLQMPEIEFIDAVNNAFVRKYPMNSLIDGAIKGVASILGTGSQTVRQLPPKLKSLYNNSRAGFPLGFGHANSYVRRGVALIGDAAHRVHPLAGMGLNLGFGDAKALTETLAKATYNGCKLDDLNHLYDYEQKQLKKNVPIMLGIHGLQRLYSTDIAPVILARSIGLQITQTVTPLKDFFMGKAMG